MDLGSVGGKNASLGELFNAVRPKGVGLVDGFATTAAAYWRLLEEGDLRQKLDAAFRNLNPENLAELAVCGHKARTAVLETTMPDELRLEFITSYQSLLDRLGGEREMAVRSSATAEDLPEASFAGAAETFLNVRGEDALLRAIQQCFASLFTDRAISYRARLGYSQLNIALSIGVMPMVRSDLASSGVIFTLDTESGFRNVVSITSAYGLGEFVVQGVVTPDEWIVFKPTLSKGGRPIVGRRLGSKEVRLVYAQGTHATRSEPIPAAERMRYSLTDDEVLTLARWACLIEDHYSAVAGHPQPMDIEWAKDGPSGNLYILQARPETVHSAKSQAAVAQVYRVKQKTGTPLVSGQAVGEKIGFGKARVVRQLSQLNSVEAGDVLVAENTDPDWEPVMRRVAAIVTDSGGRTAHAAIVSREFGIPCIVGTAVGTQVLHDGQEISVCCAEGSEGHVYAGPIKFEIEQIDASAMPPTQTKIMLIVGDPSLAFRASSIPNQGVGLARMEFIVTNHIGIHPMALVRYPDLKDQEAVKAIQSRIGNEDPRQFFTQRLAEGVGRIAAAFYPKPVIVRMSDFKTNEYAQLIGGQEFEPKEENPMLGFRGASRYYNPAYQSGFALECAAISMVRREMGLKNLKVMIPFCRTIDEALRVVEVMRMNGLEQHKEDLEIAANVVLAKEFLEIFDGYSIGSNDLTQLTLGLDRDSGMVAALFDEKNAAIRYLIKHAIQAAHSAGKPIGICGEARQTSLNSRNGSLSRE